ncbi:hypothetical protein EUX98_g4922 [Antrodiella citrinella]|uniref:Galactose oxidase n=1 Tax=Antrodiella citrinella TaxID=2447956 RepID=A0A4S4MV91_9APHY|nr:hypothetical protein EUX98_g4922 [Antrodiella citrinella]
MVIHNKSQMIYVSGGRIVDGDWDSVKYSGVYSYNVRTSTWKLLQPIDLLNVHPSIPPRFGHSMVLDTFSDTLFIFGGQRDEKYLADMYAYHIPTDSVTEIYPNFAASGGPNACFTQRAVVDPDLKEIYVFCGLTKGPPGASSILETDAPYWVYRYERPERPGVWTKLIPSTVPELSDTAQTDDAPIPRYAHQVVYDPRSKVIYMHGGNAGMEKEVVVPMSDFAPAEGQREGQRQDSDSERTAVSETRYRVLRGHSTMESPAADYGHEAEMSEDNEGTGDRLDDFWTMRLQRPSTAEIVRRGKYLIRQQRFREMCEDTPPVTALAYLQTEVSSVVDHSDSEEARVFRSLLSHLLTPAPKLMPGLTPLEHSNSATQKRKRSPEEVMIVDEDEVMEEEPEDATDRDNGMDAEPIHPVVSFQRDATEELSDVDHPYPSPERYKQRTEVFEQLMKFINEDARQPEQNLWDMIDVDYLGAKQ